MINGVSAKASSWVAEPLIVVSGSPYSWLSAVTSASTPMTRVIHRAIVGFMYDLFIHRADIRLEDVRSPYFITETNCLICEFIATVLLNGFDICPTLPIYLSS